MSGSEGKRALVLHELQRTRERNQKVLQDLRSELEDLRSSSHAFDSNNQQPMVPLVQMPPNNQYPIVYPGAVYPSAGQVGVPCARNSLASEVNLLRNEYLALGGSDPRLIHQMNDLISQALHMEQQLQPQFRLNQQQSNPDHITLKILGDYKKENDRLRGELEGIKNKKLNDKDDLSVLKKDHIIKMTAMKQELEQLEQAARIDSLKNQIRQLKGVSVEKQIGKEKVQETATKDSRTMQVDPQPSLPLIDILASAPYDPSSGFMIYHDFVLNVDPTFKSLQVMSSLMRGKTHLGAAVPLPKRDCLALHGENYHSAYLHCPINIKQPVTRCLPASDLCLLIEVLASSYYEEQFKPVCWSKFLLFDDQHRVISGRWKVPLRIVPSRPDIHPKDANNIPQSGRMEFYYRICNSRDTSVQNKVSATPTQFHQYMYAPTDDGKTN